MRYTDDKSTGGIGSATGRLLHSRGATIAALYAPFESSRRDQLLETGYGSHASSIQTYECEVTSESSVKEAFSAISSEFDKSGRKHYPSILANCTGYVNLSPMEDTPVEDTIKHLHNNILGPMIVSQAFARLYFRLSAEKKDDAATKSIPPGRIINIASQAAHVALDQHSAYCASKAGLIGLTKSMASEWGGRGITANSVSPGVVWTSLGQKAWADEAVKKAHQAQIPSGRFAEPDEVADVIAWLAGDTTGMVNGADVRIDGGFTIR